MFQRLLARLRATLTQSERSTRARDVLLPLLIISIALGGLAWRAWQLSRQMEHGANTLAMQYAGYAADVTARQLDSAAGAELFKVSDEWQQLERGMASPTAGALQSWVAGHSWIVSAIYVPDVDPASSIFASSAAPSRSAAYLTREFYPSGGLVRYTYDPAKLLAHVRSAVRVQPLVQSRSQRPAQIDVVVSNAAAGAMRTSEGFGFVARRAHRERLARAAHAAVDDPPRRGDAQAQQQAEREAARRDRGLHPARGPAPLAPRRERARRRPHAAPPGQSAGLRAGLPARARHERHDHVRVVDPQPRLRRHRRHRRSDRRAALGPRRRPARAAEPHRQRHEVLRRREAAARRPRADRGACGDRGARRRYLHRRGGPRTHLRSVLPRAVLRHPDAPRRRPRTHSRAADRRLARRPHRGRLGDGRRLHVPDALPPRQDRSAAGGAAPRARTTGFLTPNQNLSTDVFVECAFGDRYDEDSDR